LGSTLVGLTCSAGCCTSAHTPTEQRFQNFKYLWLDLCPVDLDDPEKAGLDWLEKAAEQGVASACENLSQVYRTSVRHGNYERAEYYRRKASELGWYMLRETGGE